jgi:opacity protein-like surface antigen
VAAQLGYGFKSDSNLTTSLELEVGYWGEAIDSFGYYFDVEVIPALANVKISFPMANQIEGFAGLGIGTSRFEASAVRVTQAGGVVYTVSDNIFTYQFLAGIKFFTTDNFAFKLEYRYMRFKDVLDIDSYGGGVLGGGLEFYF